MIERLAGCLNLGGRSVLRGNLKIRECRSRRHLHSAFWLHGAGSINLPAWWILLLQTPSAPDDSRCKNSSPKLTPTIMSGIEDIFLDFLYPMQTLAQIQRLKRSTIAHQQAAQTTRQRTRAYTSAAKQLIARSQGLSTIATADNVAATKVDEVQKKGKIKDDIHSLLKAEQSKPSDEIWRLYQDLLQCHGALSAPETAQLFRYLFRAPDQAGRERLLALFEAIPIAHRRRTHYTYAVEAALRLDDPQSALSIHQDGLRQNRLLVGGAAILRYTVRKENWSIALALLHPLWDSQLFYYTHQKRLWAAVTDLHPSLLLSRAASFARYATSEELLLKASIDIKAVRRLALELIERTFGRMAESNVSDAREDFLSLLRTARNLLQSDSEMAQLSEILSVGLRQLMSFKSDGYDYKQLALNEFRDIWISNPRVKLERSLLGELLNMDLDSETPKMTVELIRCIRTHHGKPIVMTYGRAMRKLATAGEAASVAELLEYFVADHPRSKDLKIFHQSIRVHYFRADPERAISALTDIRDRYGCVPDLMCYNTIMQTFCRVDDVNSARAWLEQMQQANVEPDEQTYRAIMLIYSKRGDLDALQAVLETARKKGAEQTLGMVNLQVLANINSGRLAEAEDIVEDSIALNVEGSRTPMWNFLINAYAFRGDVRKVQTLHARMREAEVPHDTWTYASLITCLCILKLPQSALKILETVMPSLGLKPNALHYGAIMEGFLRTKGRMAYRFAFSVYQQMLQQGLKPTITTQKVLIRAAARVDKDDHAVSGGLQDFPNARQVFDQVVATLDPSQMSSSAPQKYVQPDRLDEAFIANFFEHLIYLDGSTGDFASFAKDFEAYVTKATEFSGRDITQAPPLRILSALLVAHIRSGNSEEIERCWYLTIDKCEGLARNESSNDLSESNWVLFARRLIINLPLQPYIDYLYDQQRFQDMIDVVNGLLYDGYDLNHRNWNAYIQYLCASPDPRHKILALEKCESQLMPAWNSWKDMNLRFKMKNRLKGMAKANIRVKGAAPTYKTFVWLTKAFIDLGIQRESRLRKPGVQKLLESGRAMRTLEAVRGMPMLNDNEQQTILGVDPDDPESGPGGQGR